jgi:hypothetical protein
MRESPFFDAERFAGQFGTQEAPDHMLDGLKRSRLSRGWAFFGHSVLAKASTCTRRSGSANFGTATIALSGVGGPK